MAEVDKYPLHRYLFIAIPAEVFPLPRLALSLTGWALCTGEAAREEYYRLHWAAGELRWTPPTRSPLTRE